MPTPEQAPVIFAEIERSRAHLRAWMPWLDQMQRASACRQFLRQNQRKYESGQGFNVGLFAGRTFVGMLGFHGFDRLNRISGLGYWLGRTHTGQGLMTRAVAWALDYAFQEQTMNRVYLRCATANRASRAIAERLGFTHEGTQREAEWLYDHYVDLEVYSYLAREWQAARLPWRSEAVPATWQATPRRLPRANG